MKCSVILGTDGCLSCRGLKTTDWSVPVEAMVSLLILQRFRLCVLHGTADSFYSNDPQLQAEQLSGRYCLFSPPPPHAPNAQTHSHQMFEHLNHRGGAFTSFIHVFKGPEEEEGTLEHIFPAHHSCSCSCTLHVPESLFLSVANACYGRSPPNARVDFRAHSD